MLTTDHPEICSRLKLLRAHGMEPRYYHKVVGICSRLDSVQAAVMNVKLPSLDSWAYRRTHNAARYHELFREVGLDNVLGLPTTAAGYGHVWNQFIVRIPDGRRDALRKYLTDCKVGSEIYYPIPLHEQECFRGLGYCKGSLPESERAAKETIALPIFPELTDLELQTVVARFTEFFGVRRTLPTPVRQPMFLKHAQNAPAQGPGYVQYVVNG
jgi:dTDP-4-amino-4,6-dideoxygalactose transaminase